jgi:hypothetical protein
MSGFDALTRAISDRSTDWLAVVMPQPGTERLTRALNLGV